MHKVYDFSRLKELYEDQKLEPKEIAKIIGCKQRNIYTRLHEQGIPLRGVKEGFRKITRAKYLHLLDDIKKMIEDKRTKPEIAESLGISTDTVTSVIRAFDLPRTKSEWTKRERHPNWKGGYKSYHGYIRVRVYDHPYAASDGYIPLHRKLVEDRLGRYLKPDEIVHHIDGDKSNNELSNLMVLSPSDHFVRTKLCKKCPLQKEIKTLKMKYCVTN